MDADAPLDPARLENLALPTARRGLEPAAVREALGAAAAEIRRLRALVGDLETQLAPLRELTAGELEARRVAAALGAEAAQVLESAHRAAAERTDRAEREAEGVLAEARAEADRVRGEADAEADAIVGDGRRLGRELVTEAQAVRERLFGDLARRRHSARIQLEQLRAGRDRLLEALVVAQEALDRSVAELVAAVPDAQALAERAGLRVASEPEPTADTIEAEIESARLVGHPLVEGIEVPDSGPYQLDLPPEPAPELAPEETPERADAAPERDQEQLGGGGDEIDDLFERLRAGRAAAVAEAERVLGSEPPTPELAPAETAERADTAPERGEAAPDEGQAGPDEGQAAPEREDETPGTGDDAWWPALGRTLKRAVVDEQADLLDGLRRQGVAALATHLDADPADRWRPIVETFLAAAGTGAAETVAETVAETIVETVVETIEQPLRYRLRAALDEGDDVDEFTTVLRAAYRDARGRRVRDALANLADRLEGVDQLG